MRKFCRILLVSSLSVLLLLTACSTPPAPTDPATTVTTAPRSTLTVPTTMAVEDISVDAAWKEDDRDASFDTTTATAVTFTGQTAQVSGEGVDVAEAVVTITAPGTYLLSGTLDDGQLRVDTDGVVRLILNGVSIHGETTVPLFVKDADKVILTLVDGTENALSDSASCVYEDEIEQEPSGTLFSKSDVTINGGGSLYVNAAFNDGIVSRDGLKIADGNITVTAADDAVMGRDYVLVGGGTLTLNAIGDGIKSTNDADATVGFVMIEGGALTITCDKDGIQAESSLTVTNGTVTVTSGGGSRNGSGNSSYDDYWGYGSTDSSSDGKALKAVTDLTVIGGTLLLDAADDALHSNGNFRMSGGVVTAAAGDDGVHADAELLITGGKLTITKSYEGLEAGLITIENGDISVTASDDGVNASNGSTSGNRNPMASDGSAFVVNGGTLCVDAQGDGLDSNGTVRITGGVIYVKGPSNGGNGSLDYAMSFDITGGVLVVIGSTGMAETPTTNSMNSILWSGCSIASGQSLTVKNSAGTVIAEITASRTAQWAYVTSPELQTGETYTVTAGSTEKTVTLSAGVNSLGNASGNMGGMPSPGGGMGGGRPGRPW